MTPTVKAILDKYEGTPAAVKANLARILMQGRLGGTGKLIILPVDQGFEHGPARSFAVNPPAYDPHYHFQLAIDAGLSAYAAPLGMLEAGADTFAGQIPTILKINSSNIEGRAKRLRVCKARKDASGEQKAKADLKDVWRALPGYQRRKQVGWYLRSLV